MVCHCMHVVIVIVFAKCLQNSMEVDSGLSLYACCYCYCVCWMPPEQHGSRQWFVIVCMLLLSLCLLNASRTAWKSTVVCHCMHVVIVIVFAECLQNSMEVDSGLSLYACCHCYCVCWMPPEQHGSRQWFVIVCMLLLLLCLLNASRTAWK